MCYLREMKERWEAVRDTIPKITGELIADPENNKQLIKLNTDQLYEQGVKADGTQLKAYRNPAYAQMKNEMNPAPGLGIPDLSLTGAFQAAFNLTNNGNTFAINSTDEKADILVKRYGATIFGLTDESKQYAWGGILRVPFVYKLGELTGARIG